MGYTREEFAERYRSVETEELNRIVHGDREGYVPEALLAAEEELSRREDIAPPETTEGEQAFEGSWQPVVSDALPTHLKAICFLFCGIPGFAIAIYQSCRHGGRRTREAWTWVGYGWLLRVALFVPKAILRMAEQSGG